MHFRHMITFKTEINRAINMSTFELSLLAVINTSRYMPKETFTDQDYMKLKTSLKVKGILCSTLSSCRLSD